jgi:hypothetical protein
MTDYSSASGRSIPKLFRRESMSWSRLEHDSTRRDELMLLLQSLLEEPFHLKTPMPTSHPRALNGIAARLHAVIAARSQPHKSCAR